MGNRQPDQDGSVSSLTSRLNRLPAADYALVEQLVSRLVATPNELHSVTEASRSGVRTDSTTAIDDPEAQDLPGRSEVFPAFVPMYGWAENYSVPRQRGRVLATPARKLESMDEVRSFFREILAAEAPIHEDLLLLILDRARAARIATDEQPLTREQVLGALKMITVDGVRVIRDSAGFYWVPNRRRVKVRAWHRHGRFRPPRWVPNAELDQATYRLVNDHAPITVAEVGLLVRRLFAWSEGVSGVDTAITESAGRLLASGKLTLGDGGRLEPATAGPSVAVRG
jgi:hypothetical protein